MTLHTKSEWPDNPLCRGSKSPDFLGNLPILNSLTKVSRCSDSLKKSPDFFVSIFFVGKCPCTVPEIAHNEGNKYKFQTFPEGACPWTPPNKFCSFGTRHKKPSLFSPIPEGRSPYFALYLLIASACDQ